jgi:hypothetical protein
MRYRTIVVLIFSTAVATLLVTVPGSVFQGSAETVRRFSPAFERNFEHADDAQIIELREAARSAMVRLQSRQVARN